MCWCACLERRLNDSGSDLPEKHTYDMYISIERKIFLNFVCDKTSVEYEI